MQKTISYRIASLDGIRGVGILMVLLAHGATSLPNVVSDSFIYSIFANGPTAVMIFFVMSGYLITKLLLVEQKEKGQISIRNFYLKRSFRIFPVFYTYLAVILLLKNTILPEIFTTYTTFLFAALYLWNYKHLFAVSAVPETNGNWFMGHLWSLSMEEQFYLLWPLAFKKVRLETLKRIVIAIIILAPIARVATYFFFQGSRGQIDMMLHTGGDTILMGCWGALLEKSGRFMDIIKHLSGKTWLVVIAFLQLFVLDRFLSEMFGGSYSLPIGHTLNNFTILFLVFWCIYVPSPVYRFLNRKWISQIGVFSYSLYIWQQLILTNKHGLHSNVFPLNFVLVFVLAIMSHYLIEKPFLKLRSRFKT